MTEYRTPEADQFFRLIALHQYFLHADFLRAVFMRQIKSSPARDDPLGATVFVVIAVWRETGLSDAEFDALLNEEEHVDHLRIFRNQVIHYQREYDNPKLLKFLGRKDGDGGGSQPGSSAYTPRLAEPFRVRSRRTSTPITASSESQGFTSQRTVAKTEMMLSHCAS